MKLGISTASLFGIIPTENSFDVLNQMNIDTTEVFFNTFSEYEKSFIDELIPKKNGINVHSVHALGTQFEPELYSFSERVRTDALSLFKKVCAAGAQLGAKFYTFHGAVRLKKQEYVFDFDKLGQRTNELIEIAQSYGINISYENVHWCFGANPDYFEKLLNKCPKLYTTLDVKQAIQAGHAPQDFLDIMGDRISTIHLCDITKDLKTCLPGYGDFDFKKFFKSLKDRNIDANMMLECYCRDFSNLGELKDAYNYLNGLL